MAPTASLIQLAPVPINDYVFVSAYDVRESGGGTITRGEGGSIFAYPVNILLAQQFACYAIYIHLSSWPYNGCVVTVDELPASEGELLYEFICLLSWTSLDHCPVYCQPNGIYVNNMFDLITGAFVTCHIRWVCTTFMC